jgi:DedD protein
LTSALQNRLVGTIILVALIVIFVPDILDGKKQSQKDPFVNLPARPEMKAIVDAKPALDETVKQKATRDIEIVQELPIDEPASEMQSTPVDPESDSSTATKSDTSTDQKTLQESVESSSEVTQDQSGSLDRAGWVVQLGVFRHEKNVQELLDKLKKAGYRAFSRPIQTSSGELTKVFVGPHLQKQELQKAIPDLNTLTNLQGRVTPFTVQ